MRPSYALTQRRLDELTAEPAEVDLDAFIERSLPFTLRPAEASKPAISIEPVDLNSNPLRPRRLADVVGQERLKPLLRRLIASSMVTGRPLSHMLFVGAAGTGKTTLATVVANEINARTFSMKAPLAMDVLMALREAVRDRDIVFIDEIHMQVTGDRRGLTQAADPESFYLLLEDGVLSTPTGRVTFPHVTWIGATTDVGLLPQPLSDRFTIQPRLSPYTLAEMTEIARRNAQALKLGGDEEVCALFAAASRGIPRQVNAYMRSARDLAADGCVDRELARLVIEDLCSTTLDGLTASMQTVLTFLYRRCRRETRTGITYSASVNTLATACGHGRDTKAISLLVEPYLLQRGLLEVRPQGRTLTPAGVERACQLIGG